MRIEQIDLTRWAEALPEAGFEPFHTPAALSALDRHADGELRLYAAFDGDDPVGLLPAVARQHSLGTAVLSPPRDAGIPRLGPVFPDENCSPAERATRNRAFADLLVESAGVDSPLTRFRMTCPSSYADPRPFDRSDLRLSPSFTRQLPLDRSPDDIRSKFDDELRDELRAVADGDVTVERPAPDCGADAVRPIHEAVVAGNGRGPKWSYVRDVVSALGERARPYVAREDDGAFLAGVVVLAAGDVAYPWLFGAAPQADAMTVRWLHWRAVEELASADDPPAATYDFLGSGDGPEPPDGARFGAELVPHYVVDSPGKYIDAAATADGRLVH